ncbi:MAG: M23 family metallopeptidase [Rikenellaceae bacterium]
MKNVAGYYSANFGELRPDHFHSGVDIKSDGAIGKPIVAVMDGYISRISLSPVGFGLALYIAHPNGTTSVYAHLDRLREDLAEYLEQQRYAQQLSAITLHLGADKFPVSQGDLVAYSGNSGSSFGPHLHYELRETKQQKPLNLITLGVLPERDNTPPTISNLYYVEIDSLLGVAFRAPVKKFSLVEHGRGEYRISGGSKAWIGRKGYFVVQVIDRKENTTNRYGIFRITLKMDGKPIYGYRMDGFTFDLSRYSNAVSDYALQQKIGGEVFRLALLNDDSRSLYDVMVDRGLVRAEAGEEHEFELEIEDDSGNISRLNFTARGMGDGDLFRAEADTKQPVARPAKAFEYVADGLKVKIPKGALYESVPFSISATDTKIKPKSGVEILSRSYAVMDRSLPLQKGIDLTIFITPDEALRRHVVLAEIDAKGEIVYLGGGYNSGAATAQTRRFGEFVAVADTEPAVVRITAINRSAVSFTIKDNLSVITSYEASINGEWVAVDLDKELYTIRYPSSMATGERLLKIVARDGAGNETIFEKKL